MAVKLKSRLHSVTGRMVGIRAAINDEQDLEWARSSGEQARFKVAEEALHAGMMKNSWFVFFCNNELSVVKAKFSEPVIDQHILAFNEEIEPLVGNFERVQSRFSKMCTASAE